MAYEIYLASPYTHPDPEIRRERFQEACRAAGWLMRRGHTVFSPIAHSHTIGVELGGGAEMDRDFWLAQDWDVFIGARSMVILNIDGHAESKGIALEVLWARQLDTPLGRLMPLRDGEYALTWDEMPDFEDAEPIQQEGRAA